jgi:hypothetical protein
LCVRSQQRCSSSQAFSLTVALEGAGTDLMHGDPAFVIVETIALLHTALIQEGRPRGDRMRALIVIKVCGPNVAHLQ